MGSPFDDCPTRHRTRWLGVAMKAATRYNDHQRQALGLLPLATEEDMSKSIETSGVKTDVYKVLAEKMFGVEYCFVSPQQRENAKRAMFHQRY